MATSRCAGERPLTLSPPMRISPLVGSARPAMRLSVVDLPQPEGPTSERNSPSAMSRDSSLSASGAPGNALRTACSEIEATSLLLHRAGGESRDDTPLEEENQHGERQRGGDRGCGDLAPRLRVLAGEERDGDGDGALRRRREEGERIEQLVPGKDEDQDGGGGERGRRKRQVDAQEGLPGRAAVDARRPVELLGQRAEERGEEPQRERQREGGVGQDEARELVAQAQRAQCQIQRAHGGDGREHRDGEGGPEQEAPAGEAQARDGERGRAAHGGEEGGGPRRDDERVDQGAAERRPQAGVAREGERVGQRQRQLVLGPQRGQHLPAEGAEEERQRGNGGERAPHRSLPSTRKKQRLSATTQRKVATASAEPYPKSPERISVLEA